jgi:hypothetical protein
MKPVRIIVLNDRTSIYGAGVDMVGLQRMFTNQTGGVLVTDGTGSASFFGGACTPTISSSFTAPAGDFSTLATTGAGYRRTYRDGSVVTFNSRGQETSSADRFGTATQVSYVWSAETGQYVPAAITDPTGQAITFHFRTAAEAGSTYTPGSLSDIVVQGVHNAKFGILAPNGNLEHFLDVDGVWTGVAGYDTQHRITQFTNKQGGTTNFGYAYGRTLKTIDVPAVTINGVPGIQPRTQFRDAYSGLYTAADSGRGATYSTAIPVPTFDNRLAAQDVEGGPTLGPADHLRVRYVRAPYVRDRSDRPHDDPCVRGDRAS